MLFFFVGLKFSLAEFVLQSDFLQPNFQFSLQWTTPPTKAFCPREALWAVTMRLWVSAPRGALAWPLWCWLPHELGRGAFHGGFTWSSMSAYPVIPRAAVAVLYREPSVTLWKGVRWWEMGIYCGRKWSWALPPPMVLASAYTKMSSMTLWDEHSLSGPIEKLQLIWQMLTPSTRPPSGNGACPHILWETQKGF